MYVSSITGLPLTHPANRDRGGTGPHIESLLIWHRQVVRIVNHHAQPYLRRQQRQARVDRERQAKAILKQNKRLKGM